jgi:glycosyltransferase involved in cell wall biosynthesis
VSPRILVYPGDTGGCGHYRLFFPLDAMMDAGVPDVGILPVQIPVTLRRMRADGTVGVADVKPPPCDVFVVQRCTNLEFVEGMEILKHKYGIRIVVDIDDDLSCLDPKHSLYETVHPVGSYEENWHHVHRACAIADVVTVSTPALAERYGGGRAVVIPNCVPEALLDYERPERDEPLVGWCGSTGSHPNDLQITRGIVARTVPHEQFRSIGPFEAVAEYLGYDTEIEATGMVPFHEYYDALRDTYDIGIVPLADTKFNHAKSGLKALEHAAVGIPVVMSPTPDNLRLHRDGIGLIAKRPRDWQRHLRRLMTDADYRIEQGEAAKAAARKHTIQGNLERWISAWTSAATRSVLTS